MVKVTNDFGDRLTGKSGNSIYMGRYGQTVRIKGYKQDKPPSVNQKKVRDNFKDAIQWVKSLSYETKQGFKQYFKETYPHPTGKQPKTWYTFLKYIYITLPKIHVISVQTRNYLIKHSAIYEIIEFDSDGNVLNYIGNLTHFSEPTITKEYPITLNPATSKVLVNTFANKEKAFSFNPEGQPVPTDLTDTERIMIDFDPNDFDINDFE